jgi:hypothetical protein
MRKSRKISVRSEEFMKEWLGISSFRATILPIPDPTLEPIPPAGERP